MALILIRTIFLYLLTLCAMKSMGKRQLGQLQPFELVVVLIVSDMATIAMQSNMTPLLNSVVPIATIALLELLFSLLCLISQRIRILLCGKPVILIQQGILQENNMRKLRVNLNDLQELSRAQGYFDLSAIDTAIMETNGQLSVLPKTEQRPMELGDYCASPEKEVPGELLILDGKINRNGLKALGYDETWLKQRLAKAHAGQPKDLFLAGLDAKGKLFWQRKEQRQVEA